VMVMLETRVVNIYKEDYDVYIGRGKCRKTGLVSPWGNPFHMAREEDREAVVLLYEVYIRNNPELMRRLPELKGKRLGCYCKPKACHGDVLVKLVNELE